MATAKTPSVNASRRTFSIKSVFLSMAPALSSRDPSAGHGQPSRAPLLAHQIRKAPEQIMAVARPGRCLGMVLHREHRLVLEREAAVRTVEQRDMGLLDILRQRLL